MHDTFETGDEQQAPQVQVPLPTPRAVRIDEFMLLTLVVTESQAIFYENLEVVGRVAIPRPLTDCFNNFEGMLLGAAGMELGQVRFYPEE